MWKWFTSMLFALFGKSPKKMLSPLDTKKVDNNIIVKPYVNDLDDVTFKSQILKVQEEVGIAEEQIDDVVTKILEEHLPKEYKAALKSFQKEIILTSYALDKGMQNNNVLKLIYPVLKKRLATLGITKVTYPTPGGIFIETENITQASHQWHDPLEVTIDFSKRLHKQGPYR